jgi:nucleoside-diphosphate-sugar epimerase
MIIGGGLIANAFKNQKLSDSVIVFASGVANSKNLSQSDCEREINLLKEVISKNTTDKIILYFSTFSIDNPAEQLSAYVIHKLNAEKYIQQHCKNYLIIRTGNVVGNSGNLSTIFNFILYKVKYGEEFDLWVKAKRNFLDVDHLAMMAIELIETGYKNKICYLLNPVDIGILELLTKIESFLGKKANCRVIDKESAVQNVDKELSISLFDKLGIAENDYVDSLIGKYGNNEKI